MDCLDEAQKPIHQTPKPETNIREILQLVKRLKE